MTACLKIVILGNAGVGKTAIRHQFLHESFTTTYKATIGVDFITKQISSDNGTVSLQIWDTAGQERFQSIGTSFYRGADACILVYDITNVESLTSLSKWITTFLKYSQITNAIDFPFFIVGNKVDLNSRRKITHEQALAMADLLKLHCIEHSGRKISSPKDSPPIHHRYARKQSRLFGVNHLDERQNYRESIVSFYTAHSDLDDDIKPSKSAVVNDIADAFDSMQMTSRTPLYNPDEIPCLETSAKTGLGIEQLFEFVASHVPIPDEDLVFNLDRIDIMAPQSKKTYCC